MLSANRCVQGDDSHLEMDTSLYFLRMISSQAGVPAAGMELQLVEVELPLVPRCLPELTNKLVRQGEEGHVE